MKIDTGIDTIMAYEDGQLGPEEVVELFQQLVDNGMAWQLQGSYGRMAASLIEAGLVSVPQGKPCTGPRIKRLSEWRTE
jgi:hypothetical protein